MPEFGTTVWLEGGTPLSSNPVASFAECESYRKRAAKGERGSTVDKVFRWRPLSVQAQWKAGVTEFVNHRRS